MRPFGWLWFVLLVAAPAGAETVWLDSLDLSEVRQGWGTAQASRSVQGNPLRVAGRRFARGIGTHAESRFVVDLGGRFTRFSAWVGADDEMAGHPASVQFEVRGDARSLWRSPVMRLGTPPARAEVSVAGVQTLELIVTDAGDGVDSDHADWCEACVEGPKGARLPRIFSLAGEDLQPLTVRPGWAEVRAGSSFAGGSLRVAGRSFARGLCCRGGTDLLYTGLSGRFARFTGWVGLDDTAPVGAVARCRVFVDGREAVPATTCRAGEPARRVSARLGGGDELRLVVEPSGPADTLVDWGEPALEPVANAPRPAARRARGPSARVSSGPLDVEVGADGQAAFALRGPAGVRRVGTVALRLAGCVGEGRPRLRRLTGGGLEVTRDLRDPVTGRRARLVERLLPLGTSVRWEAAVTGEGAPWSTGIETRLRWPASARTRFWTAWADARGRGATGWSDPLRPAALRDARWWYGAPAFREDAPLPGYAPFRYDVFCLPLATLMDGGVGLSLVQSPEDALLDMALTTDRSGGVTLTRMNHRLAPGRPVPFAVDLVPHGADWRPGVGWMARRYPAYFDPPNPAAPAAAGTGAYSTWQGAVDADRLRRMAFRVNWQASYEFPYMGLFLPPVADGVAWTNFRGVATSCRTLDDYYRRMRSLGFLVLSYFNVTEFGARLQFPPPPRRARDDADLWRDPNDLLYAAFPRAILPGTDGRPIPSWEGAFAMDPGDPAYAAFLLEQARRHIARTPATAGFCIDRTDWLRYYNRRADDGESWFEGAPARSLLTSWRALMARLGPMVHAAGKMLFANCHVKRLEVLRQFDGIFDEFTYHPASLNPCGLLGLNKPVIGWVADVSNLKPDPDGFFQRFLHLGVYPMAPYPGNDHSIQPDAWAERLYLDYGPLLDAMRGKRWVLAPGAVEVVGARALANLFAVPGGLVAPVTFGGERASATLLLRDLPAVPKGTRWAAEVIWPGESVWRSAPATVSGKIMRVEAPLRRGCAMVRLRRARAGTSAREARARG